MSRLTFPELNQRAIEWGRWSRMNGFHRSRCASAEGGYRMPMDDCDRDAVAQVPVDHLAAERFEHAVVAVRSELVVRVLMVCYVDNWSPKVLCRKLGVAPDMVHQLKSQVLIPVGDALSEIEREPIQLIRRGRLIWAGLRAR